MQPAKRLDDQRDQNGNPAGLKQLRENLRKRFGNVMFRLSGNEEQVTVGDVDQSQRNNELLPWFVILALVAGAALALTIEDRMGRAQELDWAMRTAKAEMRAETAQAVAKAQEQAESAAAVSDVWRNRVNKLEAELNADRRR